MSDHAGTTSIAVEKRGEAVVVRPQMKMMEDDALKALTRMIDQTTGPGSGIGGVVVDLSHVAVLPSLALGRLVGISNDCKSRGLRLKLAGLRPQIRQVFAVTRLDRIFKFADTVEDALRG